MNKVVFNIANFAAQQKEYYEANKDKKAAYQREYRAAKRKKRGGR